MFVLGSIAGAVAVEEDEDVGEAALLEPKRLGNFKRWLCFL
jgi:hypothetical protein